MMGKIGKEDKKRKRLESSLLPDKDKHFVMKIKYLRS